MIEIKTAAGSVLVDMADILETLAALEAAGQKIEVIRI